MRFRILTDNPDNKVWLLDMQAHKFVCFYPLFCKHLAILHASELNREHPITQVDKHTLATNGGTHVPTM